jgi:protein MPE1
MVNAEGEYVIAEPDKASWEQFQAKTKFSAAAQKAAALGDKEMQDRGLECSIDKRIFIDPMKTPCCDKTYCNDCITNALIESDFTCPGCQTDGVLIDDLKPDIETSKKVTDYLAEKNAAAKKEPSKSPRVKSPTPPAEAKERSPSPKSPEKINTPPAISVAVDVKPPNAETAPATSQPQTKKRPADELLENPKIPKGPKAMQQQEAQKQAMLKQQQNMMNGMSGFPNMSFNPMMGMNGLGGMPNMNMNMMNGFSMNPMMGMPMMGMNGGMNGFGGAPLNGMNNMYVGAGGFGGMGNMGMMSNSMVGGQTNGAGPAGGFSNQQKTVFAEPLPNEEDNAYFRKPVNPHRHQGRQRRARPSDYREL